MSWNLHVVGEKVLDEAESIAEQIVKVLEDAGHQLVSAVLTTDVGPKEIAVQPPAPAPEPAPAPPEPSPAPEPAPAPAPDPAPVDPAPPA